MLVWYNAAIAVAHADVDLIRISPRLISQFTERKENKQHIPVNVALQCLQPGIVVANAVEKGGVAQTM